MTGTGSLPAEIEIRPVDGPIDATVTVPGSRSITNRALVCAALASGTSTLTGALLADDTEAMLGALEALGAPGAVAAPARLSVTGRAGRLPDGPLALDARLSGTTSRFLLAMSTLGAGPYRLDGRAPLRARPMADGVDAVRQLGVTVRELGEPGCLPVEIVGGPVEGGEVRVAGDVSSQFLSGALLVAPCWPSGGRLHLVGELVSRPYVEMTRSVMGAFGATATWEDDVIAVAPGGYAAADYAVEPDAATASYFFAAGLVTGGRVRVSGLARRSIQGDLALVEVFARMGATVREVGGGLEVAGGGALHGVRADLRDFSDMAQTLAAVAVFAEGPTEVTGIGFIRRKETDRLHAVVTELRRCGIDAAETADGFVVHPGAPRPARIETYDDHRMAMSFALLGLRSGGIRIVAPAVVAKTVPTFWELLDGLRPGGGIVGRVQGP